ncbi:universal stress protein [Streptomyces sp. ME18-1-4]|uniref:universal stress protein n=1 Tax=Streptomyces sp. ME18-1-4 TaxID=3028685 RepID=UPI0029A4BE90|nr:universal stress protein [Streptomyces sp. ME18-1-4]MDX3241368.1 universal stress protein [Streptomyces sp. ME18-1-4]
MSGPVLVGVDGSATSLAAVEAAAREADRLGVALRLTHARPWPTAPVPRGVAPWEPGGIGSSGPANGALAEAERRACNAAPGVRVMHTVLMGEPATVLATESRRASLTVVGSRPTSRFGSGRRGSLAARLAAHGGSPVLMVRGEPDPAGPVVLACDDGDIGRRAAEFAFAEASAHATDVVVLNGFRSRNGRPQDGPHDALAALREKYRDVTVRRPRVRGGTRRAVIEASTHAQLVVIGTRCRSGWTAAVPATVSRAALRNAGCPVAVIRDEGESR